jgi:hypothetical protein
MNCNHKDFCLPSFPQLEPFSCVIHITFIGNVGRIIMAIGKIMQHSYTRKNNETRQVKRSKHEENHMPKPEEHEGMPQHQQCLHAKRREDGNPNSHEEQQNDVA